MTIRESKTTKLSDTHRVLLSAASQRQDRCLVRSENMTERAFARAVNALEKQGLVAAIERDLDRVDPLDRAEGAPAFAITLAGLAAIGCSEPTEEIRVPTKTGRRTTAQLVVPPPVEDVIRKNQPTKRALIIAMLSRDDGASLDDLIAATGWLAHTTRAALTGLRQKGHCIERTQREGRTSVYRIVAGAAHEQAA